MNGIEWNTAYSIQQNKAQRVHRHKPIVLYCSCPRSSQLQNGSPQKMGLDGSFCLHLQKTEDISSHVDTSPTISKHPDTPLSILIQGSVE